MVLQQVSWLLPPPRWLNVVSIELVVDVADPHIVGHLFERRHRLWRPAPVVAVVEALVGDDFQLPQLYQLILLEKHEELIVGKVLHLPELTIYSLVHGKGVVKAEARGLDHGVVGHVAPSILNPRQCHLLPWTRDTHWTLGMIVRFVLCAGDLTL